MAPGVPEEGRLARLLLATARRLDEGVSAAVARSDLRPRLTVAKVAAYGIAACVYLAAIGLVAGGIALAVTTPNFLSIFVGLGLATLGFLMRPRLGKPPKDDIVSRSEAPTLYGLIDDVATAIGTPPVDVLVVNADYNASWRTVGLRRRRVLTLGLPLLTALDPQEQVALIAHELAHARNGDSSRGFVVGGALNGIAEVCRSLTNASDTLAFSDFPAVQWLIHGLLWLLSRPVLGLYYVLLLLLLRDSQRAEYLADALGARVAGSKAEIGSQEKLLLASIFDTVALRSLHGSDQRIFEELHTAIRGVPGRELDRRRRVARLEGTRLSATHPPTARRLDLIESRAVEPGEVLLDDERAIRIDEDLRPLQKALGTRIADNYRSSLYD
jgi:Zn-dependent protease with chaperone function